MKKLVLIVIFLNCLITCGYSDLDRFPDFEGLWFSPGISAGISGDYYYSGVEMSMSYMFFDLYYGGVFIEADRLFNKSDTRLFAGPQIGFLLGGVDGGFVCDYAGGKKTYGYSIRPFIIIPYYVSLVIFYRRVEMKNPSWNGSNEFGLEFKVPFALNDQW